MQIDKGGIRFIMVGSPPLVCLAPPPRESSRAVDIADCWLWLPGRAERGGCDVPWSHISRRNHGGRGGWRRGRACHVCLSRLRFRFANRACVRAQGIYAEGKQHAMGIGIMKMSSTDMCGHDTLVHPLPLLLSSDCWFDVARIVCVVCSREVNKGVGIETVHVLNDNFWRLGDVSSQPLRA